MSTLAKLHNTRKQDTINVNVSPTTNINVTNRELSSTEPISEPIPVVQYPELNDDYQWEKICTLTRENEALKIIIQIMQSNPLIVNKCIIADDEALSRIIKLLCNADDVQINAEDIGKGCISKVSYRKVHSIYVITNGATKNLKYDYSGTMHYLQSLGISTKFVW